MIPVPTFRPNAHPTLGVEVELQLIDARTMSLRSAFAEVLEGVPAGLRDHVKPEFMQCYAELDTGICPTVADVARDLGETVRAVERAAAARGVRLAWAGTHPFSCWRDQEITPDRRYYKLADWLGETVTRPVTFGLHVHVGVGSGDAAIRAMDRLRHHLPTLLALSANSPFWNGRATGHHAHRIEVLEGFPTGGLPPALGSWGGFLGLVEPLGRAGFIDSLHELWWDVRPNPGYGTVEVRICDMPPDLPSVLGLIALIQCLVVSLGREEALARPEPPHAEMIARQNRWRAYRYGLDAKFVEPDTLEPIPARIVVERLVTWLRRVAGDLGCARELDSVLDMAAMPGGSEWQTARYEQTGDLVEVVRGMVDRSSLGGGATLPSSDEILTSTPFLAAVHIDTPAA